MDVNSIKVGDVLNLGTTNDPNYRLVLDVTPETFWLGNYAHGRLHVCKEEMAKATMATPKQREEYYSILKRNKVVYVDANGCHHPRIICPFKVGDLVKRKDSPYKGCHVVKRIDEKLEGVFLESGCCIPFDELVLWKKLSSEPKDMPTDNAIILNGTRYDLVDPVVESCENCDLDKFCDNFKEALCNAIGGGRTNLIFKKAKI